MIKKVCIYMNENIPCGKMFRVRDKKRKFCRKHSKSNRPNRKIG